MVIKENIKKFSDYLGHANVVARGVGVGIPAWKTRDLIGPDGKYVPTDDDAVLYAKALELPLSSMYHPFSKNLSRIVFLKDPPSQDERRYLLYLEHIVSQMRELLPPKAAVFPYPNIEPTGRVGEFIKQMNNKGYIVIIIKMPAGICGAVSIPKRKRRIALLNSMYSLTHTRILLEAPVETTLDGCQHAPTAKKLYLEPELRSAGAIISSEIYNMYRYVAQIFGVDLEVKEFLDGRV